MNYKISTLPQTTDGRIPSNKRIFKIIVIGDSGVGKTSLTYCLSEGKTLDNCTETVGLDLRSRDIKIQNEEITLQFWDTAGQERFRRSMAAHYFRNTDAILLVYDVTTPTTFDSLKSWLQECELHCENFDSLPKILIGNKCDDGVQVSRQRALKFADSNKMPLFETSAKVQSEIEKIEGILMTLGTKLKYQKVFRQTPRAIVLSERANAETGHRRCCVFS